MIASARKWQSSLAQSVTGPPLGPALNRKGKEKGVPLTRLRQQRTGIAEAVAKAVQFKQPTLPVVLPFKMVEASATGGQPPSGSDKEGWRPRWNNKWGEGIPFLGAVWNLLANAELMTPIGRRFIPNPEYSGNGLSPPQKEPQVCYIDNVLPFDQALLKARAHSISATEHSRKERAKHSGLTGPPPGKVDRVQDSALTSTVPVKADDSSMSLAPFLEEQKRLRALNIHVTVENLQKARAKSFEPTVVAPVLDVSKIDDAPPWDEEDEPFTGTNYISDEDAELNRQALAELKAEKLLDEQQRTYESDISDNGMSEATVQARMRMFGDRIGMLMNRDGGASIGVGCVSKFDAKYPGEVTVSFQIAEGLWYEARMTDIKFFTCLENYDFEADNFVWVDGFPATLHREVAKMVFERHDLTSYECVGDNELLLFTVTDLVKIGNWINKVSNKYESNTNEPTDAALQMEYAEYRQNIRQLHAKVRDKSATSLVRFSKPEQRVTEVVSEGGDYQRWLQSRAAFNKVRDDQQYWAWLESTDCLNKPRPSSVLARAKASVLSTLSKVSSWMNEEVEVTLPSVNLKRKDVRPQVMEEISELELKKINTIARSIAQRAVEKSTSHEDDYDLKWLEGLGVTKDEATGIIREHVIEKKLGKLKEKYTVSDGGIIMPKLVTFDQIRSKLDANS
jgi:hypothetical protein